LGNNNYDYLKDVVKVIITKLADGNISELPIYYSLFKSMLWT